MTFWLKRDHVLTCCFSGLSVGRARPLLQEIPGALLAFEMARRIRKAKRNELLLRLGTAKLLQQDGPGALQAFEEAWRIREAQEGTREECAKQRVKRGRSGFWRG